MTKYIFRALMVTAGCVIININMAQGQDVPGVSAGAFVERRTDAKIGDNELSFDYVGLRLKVRDERFIEGFVDVGIQELELKRVKTADSGAFGLGGILWLTRSDGELIPLDAGLYGSLHVADYTLKSDDGNSTDARYSRYMAQGIVRAFDSQTLRPYIRAGIAGTKLSPGTDGVLPSDGLDAVKPAVNVGAEYSIGRNVVLSVEGNYTEGVGGAIRLDYWF